MITPVCTIEIPLNLAQSVVVHHYDSFSTSRVPHPSYQNTIIVFPPLVDDSTTLLVVTSISTKCNWPSANPTASLEPLSSNAREIAPAVNPNRLPMSLWSPDAKIWRRETECKGISFDSMVRSGSYNHFMAKCTHTTLLCFLNKGTTQRVTDFQDVDMTS